LSLLYSAHQWCEEQGLEFRLRVVSEVRRGVTGRDEYERVSRDLRYATYRAVLRDFGCGGGVIFGHHMGDVQENVISNVMRLVRMR
jgi:tRNA(Ile)-lysidine synthase TilS/MesJ